MSTTTRSAIGFVIFIGLTSLFADMTYEGARSINGPFLALLGASATIVGFVSGFGELAGYAVRFASGIWCDRTGRYWPIVFIGYGINLLAVPALALIDHWPLAAALMILERIGKGIRTPVRDTMLSHATQQMGRGWGFGLHEAMDQTGATIGPLIVSAVLYFRHDYAASYGVLLIPAVLALIVLTTASRLYPRPRDLEARVPKPTTQGVPRSYWLYLAAAALVALGFADFPLIAFHFEKTGIVPTAWIPVFSRLRWPSMVWRHLSLDAYLTDWTCRYWLSSPQWSGYSHRWCFSAAFTRPSSVWCCGVWA